MESHIKFKNVWQVKDLQECLPDVWQLKELQAHFSQVWQGKRLWDLFFERTIGGMPEGVQEASR
jgi:hypothetical protein